ncbi:MAG: hypothetical protein AMXMBFR82_40850 [Candidatus Hydrogenedentota bacterium]
MHRALPLTFLGTLAAGLMASGIVEADPPADFTVYEAGGDNVFRLSDAKSDYVALHFLLKTDCPICLRTTRDYAARAGEVPGVTHVFLKPDPEEATVAWADGLKPASPDAPPAPTIYQDPDAQLAEAFGIPDGYEFHGEVVHYPALIVLDSDGKEVFRHVGKDTRDRYSFDDFKSKIAELRRWRTRHHYNLVDGEPALNGFDPVSYFRDGPEMGDPALSEQYAGATYLFESEENRNAFAEDPEKYLPEYGGWCATAMAGGDMVEVDPRNYTITDGRLFLFYSGLIQNARTPWIRNEKELTEKADRAWHEISGE